MKMPANDKASCKARLEEAAQKLKLNGADDWKRQAPHELALSTVCCDAGGIKDPEIRRDVYNAVRHIGHGFGTNASAHHQWIEKPEKSGVKADALQDLDV